jgi:hypothetical protein
LSLWNLSETPNCIIIQMRNSLATVSISLFNVCIALNTLFHYWHGFHIIEEATLRIYLASIWTPIGHLLLTSLRFSWHSQEQTFIPLYPSSKFLTITYIRLILIALPSY